MDKNPKPEYAVGYKKPPRHTQFKAGQSGNAKGRPRKDQPIPDVFLKELRSKVLVNAGGKVKKLSKLEAIALQQVNKAAAGDPKATALVLDLIRPITDEKGNQLPELLDAFRKRNNQNMEFDQRREEAAKKSRSAPADALQRDLK